MFFENLDKMPESDKNPKCLVKKLRAEGSLLPAVCVTCGDAGALLDVNEDFVKFLKEQGVDVPLRWNPGIMSGILGTPISKKECNGCRWKIAVWILIAET